MCAHLPASLDAVLLQRLSILWLASVYGEFQRHLKCHVTAGPLRNICDPSTHDIVMHARELEVPYCSRHMRI